MFIACKIDMPHFKNKISGQHRHYIIYILYYLYLNIFMSYSYDNLSRFTSTRVKRVRIKGREGRTTRKSTKISITIHILFIRLFRHLSSRIVANNSKKLLWKTFIFWSFFKTFVGRRVSAGAFKLFCLTNEKCSRYTHTQTLVYKTCTLCLYVVYIQWNLP